MSSLLGTENGLATDIFVVNYTGRGLVVKRPGVLSKVQLLNVVLGVGVFSLLPIDTMLGGRRCKIFDPVLGWDLAPSCGRYHSLKSRTKNQPKEEVLGTHIPRTSGGHSRGYPGPKLRSGRSKSRKEKQACGRGHP